MSDTPDPSIEKSAARPHRATILPLDRFNAFSDGVFAIAITLLVLEIAVPPLSSPVFPSILELWPDFLGYLISFCYIGGFWITHSSLSHLMKRGDSIAYGINLLLLIFIALLPFSTRLMVVHLPGPDVSDAVFIYGLNVLLAVLALSLLMFYVVRQPLLLTDEVTHLPLEEIYRRRWIGIALGAFAVVLALIAPHAAVALYLGVAVLYLVLPLLGGAHLIRHSAMPKVD